MTTLVELVTRHVKNVKQADGCVEEAGRRAQAVQVTVKTLQKGMFPKQHQSYTETLKALYDLNELVSKWDDKTFWQKTYGVSLSEGKSSAKKYADKFEVAFKVHRNVFIFRLSFPPLLGTLAGQNPLLHSMSRRCKKVNRTSSRRSYSMATPRQPGSRLQSRSCKKTQMIETRGKRPL